MLLKLFALLDSVALIMLHPTQHKLTDTEMISVSHIPSSPGSDHEGLVSGTRVIRDEVESTAMKRLRICFYVVVGFGVLVLCTAAATVLFTWSKERLSPSTFWFPFFAWSVPSKFTDLAPSDTISSNPGLAAEVLSVMDRTVDPCNDFYTFACGGWLQSNSIPADRTR